jgi:DNA-binding NarL/FixJ family response regulator
MVVRIILANDHEGTRQLTKEAIERDPNNLIVAEAESGTEALELTLEHKPDILISDFFFPDMVATKIIQALRSQGSATKVLICSSAIIGAAIYECFEAGAGGYVEKLGLTSITVAIEAITRGERFIDPNVLDLVGNPFWRNKIIQIIRPLADS